MRIFIPKGYNKREKREVSRGAFSLTKAILGDKPRVLNPNRNKSVIICRIDSKNNVEEFTYTELAKLLDLPIQTVAKIVSKVKRLDGYLYIKKEEYTRRIEAINTNKAILGDARDDGKSEHPPEDQLKRL